MHRHTDSAPDIMIWGGIGFHCPPSLVRIAGTLNSQCYICEVLEPVLFSYIQHLPSTIFQKDNAQPHVTRSVQEFFFTLQIGLFPWPACSPDLSPIENMGSILAKRHAWGTPPASTPDQFLQFLEATWTALPHGYIQNLFILC
ncbi:transposable element Tcb1 transposase [Trichonephila clavipes]|uniref:Transposable element Tcb1 transposase n=1 Tax=Trichonephila clavipes TaxID=2585209 RepID=A0A8X6SXJ9_TRICX|nr:transposable element Tcb1 transposase [Trichonephila clavipes]